MQTSFGTLAAMAIIAAGFFLTGDLSWCVERISRVLDGGSRAAPPSPEAGPESEAVPPATGTAAATPETEPPASGPARDRPSRAATRPHGPPTASLERVDLATVTPARRVVVWTAAAGGPQCHVLHPLDPASGAALLQRRSREGDGPAIRVAVFPGVTAADPAGSLLVRGGRMRVRPLGIAHGEGGAEETLGPILALAVE